MLQRSLRRVPELEHFSPQQREDLLLSFAPPALLRRTLASSAFRGVMISYMAGIAAQFIVPPGVALAIIAAVLVICVIVSYVIFCRQIRDEFQVLLQYMLTGQVLPACPRCGYDLQGATHPQCPECGADVKWKGEASGHAPVESPGDEA